MKKLLLTLAITLLSFNSFAQSACDAIFQNPALAECVENITRDDSSFTGTWKRCKAEQEKGQRLLKENQP